MLSVAALLVLMSSTDPTPKPSVPLPSHQAGSPQAPAPTPVPAPNPAQNPTPPAPTTGAKVDPEYTLDYGDTIAVTVYNHPELSGVYVIPSGGWVQFPVVGSVRVIGFTIAQVQNKLNAQLKKQLLKNPQVTVAVSIPRPLLAVTVMGDVQKGGPIPAIPGLNLASVIGASGGLIPGAKAVDVTVTVLQNGGKSLQFPLVDVLSGVPGTNIPIQPGDTVEVDAGSVIVYVAGQVKTPGVHELTRGAGVLQAIAAAGGQDEDAAISQVRITHIDGSSETVDLTPGLVKGKPMSLPALKKGDLVTIPQDTNQIAVLGYVSAPGKFVVPDGMTYNLSDAISLAKGQDLQKRGSFSKVVVTRMVNGKPKAVLYDFTKFLKKGDVTQNPELMASDVVYVPETNAPPTAAILSGIATLGIFYQGYNR